MKVYHVLVTQEDAWFCASAMEDPAVFTQGRTLDEIITNIREVANLMYDETDVQVELIVPPGVPAPPKRKRSRGARASSSPARPRRKVKAA
jgi:predicted RNase H-like HicB family nuclease